MPWTLDTIDGFVVADNHDDTPEGDIIYYVPCTQFCPMIAGNQLRFLVGGGSKILSLKFNEITTSHSSLKEIVDDLTSDCCTQCKDD